MKLRFTRNCDNGISIELVEEQQHKEFSYIELIKFLHINKSLEAPEFVGEISEEEQRKINEMILAINEAAVSADTGNTEE